MSDFKLVKLLDELGININIDNDGLLHKFDATADPTVTDDTAAGYGVGSRWVNVTSDEAFVLVDATNGAAVWQSTTSSSTDINAKVSSNDTTTGFLEDKIVAGTNVTVTTLNDGANETLEISSSGGGASPLTTKGDLYTYDTDDARLGVGSNGEVLIADSAETTGLRWGAVSTTDELLKVSSNDTTAGYLEDKIVSANNRISVSTLNDGGDEDLQLTLNEGNIDHDALTNTHNLTTDIDHNTITNNHNLTTDIDHDTITNTHNLTTDIDHNALTNYDVGQHRVINDAGTSATELWSASKIDTELSGKADTSHTHSTSDITSGTFADARISESSVTQHEAAIDHDALSNFVANEHIDWTQAGAGTIHASNYVDNDTIYTHPNHTGEVTSTGDGAQVLDPTAISNKTLVTAVSGDMVLIEDATDGLLKRVNANDFLSGGGITTIDAATDTDFTSLAEGETMRWDNSASDWINTSQILIGDDTIALTPTAPGTNPYSVVVDGAGTNLVENAIFENNITDFWSAELTPTLTYNTTEQYIGSGCLEIDTNVINEGVRSDAITVSSNTDYVYSIWIKGAVGDEDVYIGVDLDSTGILNAVSDNVFADSFVIINPVTTGWQRVFFPFTTGGSDTSAELLIRSRSGDTQKFYVDAVQLEQKDAPASSDEVNAPTTFISGDMGEGYSWSGTAYNSTASRTAGAKFLSPITGGRGNFAIREDGTIARFFADAGENQWGDFGNVIEPNFPFTFNGNIKSNVTTSGVSAGVVNIQNLADGNALSVYSENTTASTLVVSGPSATSGNILAIFAPADLTNFTGSFLTFSGKAQDAEMYQFKRDFVQNGALSFQYGKDVITYGGGSQTSTARVLAGTVSATNGSPTVTGSGFLTDFRRGQAIDINGTIYSIASIESDTSLTLTSNYGQATNAARPYDGLTAQYAPPTLQLEGAYAYHGSTGTITGDFLYGVYASGGNGHLRVLKSSTRGAAANPTADGQGDGIVTSRVVDNSTTSISASSSETTVVSGYTIPAYELRDGTMFRLKFSGSMTTLATSTTITWRLKLGGNTILTSPAQQSGSTAALEFKGEIEFVGTSDTAQRSSISVMGKNTGTGAALTHGMVHYETGSVDMRIDRALTLTAQFSDGSSMDVYFKTLEIM
jgi:hypothetical protein